MQIFEYIEVLSGVCEDRADSVMLMLESGSIRGVGLRSILHLLSLILYINININL